MRAFLKPKFIILYLIIFGIIVLKVLTSTTQGLSYYIHHIFIPLQNFRGILFNWVPFSIGDVYYMLVVLGLLFGLGRFVYFTLNPRKHKRRLFRFGINTLNICLGLYLAFFTFWGANYARPSLGNTKFDASFSLENLIALNEDLLATLNTFDSVKEQPSLHVYNETIAKDFIALFGNEVPRLQVKPTLFGKGLNYLGIQGFYNPFTGEGQFVKALPNFMWGFVIAHEMAHQAGIASEGEANFLAYMVCLADSNKLVQYSGYFNLFLYANGQLKSKDSALANQIFEQLSSYNKNNFSTLKNMRQQYRSVLRNYSLFLYNWFLKNRGQNKGIYSYSQVSEWVYYWELQGKPKINLYQLE